MKHKPHLSLLFLTILLLSFTSQQQVQAIPAIPIEIDQKIPPMHLPPPTTQPHGTQQILQIQQSAQDLQTINEQLPQWISDELQQAQTYVQLPITQTFSFVLGSQEQTIFKWDPSKEKELKLIVNVFYLTANGDVAVIQDAQQTEYLQITARNPNAVFFGLLDKVYRSKIITVDFDTDYKHIKFTNKNSQRVLVSIDIQQLSFVVSKGVPDDQLTTARNKMDLLLTESQSTEIRREHLYKWQWGFFDNERMHDVKVLGLTGVELVAILGTACVQMYCLKGLLDNRAVV